MDEKAGATENTPKTETTNLLKDKRYFANRAKRYNARWNRRERIQHRRLEGERQRHKISEACASKISNFNPPIRICKPRVSRNLPQKCVPSNAPYESKKSRKEDHAPRRRGMIHEPTWRGRGRTRRAHRSNTIAESDSKEMRKRSGTQPPSKPGQRRAPAEETALLPASLEQGGGAETRNKRSGEQTQQKQSGTKTRTGQRPRRSRSTKRPKRDTRTNDAPERATTPRRAAAQPREARPRGPAG